MSATPRGLAILSIVYVGSLWYIAMEQGDTADLAGRLLDSFVGVDYRPGDRWDLGIGYSEFRGGSQSVNRLA